MGNQFFCCFKQLFLVTILVSIFAMDPASARENTLEYRFDIKGEYSDNIAFETNPRDDYYFSAKPSITYRYLTERVELNSRAMFNFIRYQQETLEDRENQDYSLSGKYSATSRLMFDGEASFRTDTTQETELLETGEVTTKQNRDRYIGRGSINWRLSELSIIAINYNYLKKEFERETSIDYDRHSISLPFSRYFNNGRDIFSVTPVYEYRDSKDGELNNYNVSLGWQHSFSEVFSLFISAGGRYTEQKLSNGLNLDDQGIIATASLRRETETMNLDFEYGRNLYTNVVGGETEVDQFSLNLDRKILRRLRVGVEGRYYLRRTPGESSDGDRTFYQVRPTLYYRLTEKQRLEIGYMYANQNIDAAEDKRTKEQSTVWLVLKLAYDTKWQ